MYFINGEAGIIEIAEMIKCLEELAENLKIEFPKAKTHIKKLKKSGSMQEEYKRVEKKERKRWF